MATDASMILAVQNALQKLLGSSVIPYFANMNNLRPLIILLAPMILDKKIRSLLKNCFSVQGRRLYWTAPIITQVI
ncbi:unnamed protein product [Larinioides sclopetarius]|uniref:Uncharacterized protein n=1 Tax=Larinioides sclopetarius TaxID=280406 RepID=A0AAV1ZJ73_9ARAC